jgi:hypothetical protein
VGDSAYHTCQNDELSLPQITRLECAKIRLALAQPGELLSTLVDVCCSIKSRTRYKLLASYILSLAQPNEHSLTFTCGQRPTELPCHIGAIWRCKRYPDLPIVFDIYCCGRSQEVQAPSLHLYIAKTFRLPLRISDPPNQHLLDFGLG